MGSSGDCREENVIYFFHLNRQYAVETWNPWNRTAADGRTRRGDRWYRSKHPANLKRHDFATRPNGTIIR